MSAQSASSNPTVLVVDADPNHLRFYQTELQSRGYNVICTKRGQHALKRIQRQKFDIAVVDTTLTDIDGLELVNEIAISCSRMPIIIHTAEPFYANNFRSWAADAVVTKSTNTAELLERISYFLEKH
jgi:DNA-binding response OmpR family regulator